MLCHLMPGPAGAKSALTSISPAAIYPPAIPDLLVILIALEPHYQFRSLCTTRLISRLCHAFPMLLASRRCTPCSCSAGASS